MTRKKHIYSSEFKTQAISMVREAKRPAAEVSRDLGINVNTLYNWLSTATDKPSKKLSGEDYAAENKRLKKALAQAELERDILKKAAAYFAKETL
jgi:transposase